MANRLKLLLTFTLIAIVFCAASVVVVRIVIKFGTIVFGWFIPTSTQTAQVFPSDTNIKIAVYGPETLVCKELDNGCVNGTQLQTIEVRPLAYSSQRKVFKLNEIMHKCFAGDRFEIILPPASYFGVQFKVSLKAHFLLQTTEKGRWQISVFISPFNQQSINKTFSIAFGNLSKRNRVQEVMYSFSSVHPLRGAFLLCKETIDVPLVNVCKSDTSVDFSEFHITFTLDNSETLSRLPVGIPTPLPREEEAKPVRQSSKPSKPTPKAASWLETVFEGF